MLLITAGFAAAGAGAPTGVPHSSQNFAPGRRITLHFEQISLSAKLAIVILLKGVTFYNIPPL
jgi:hypothetical protein